jgi:integrase
MPVRRHGQRWQARVATGGGRRVEQTLPPGATRADALALEATLRRRQIDHAAGRRPHYLIDEAIDLWLPAAQRLKSWPKDLRYRVDVVKVHTAGRTLAELADVAARIVRLGTAENYSAAHINRHLAILRRAARLAEQRGWIERASRIAPVPGERQRHVYLTPDQVRQLMRAADPLTADVILFAALTGLRRGELLRLQPDDVRDGVILLDARTKSGRPRAVPMPPEAARIARRRLPWGIGDALLRKRFEMARKAAGLPAVRFHDLRHTFASWLLHHGSSLADVRDLLGHSDSRVTDRYAHLAPSHLARAVARLPRVRHGTKAKKKAA